MSARENEELVEVRYFCPTCRAESGTAGTCEQCKVVELKQCGWCEQCGGHYRIEVGSQCPTHGTTLVHRIVPKAQPAVASETEPSPHNLPKKWPLSRLLAIALAVVGIPTVALLERTFSLRRLDTFVAVCSVAGMVMLLWERRNHPITLGLAIVGVVIILLLERANVLDFPYVIFAPIVLFATLRTFSKPGTF